MTIVGRRTDPVGLPAPGGMDEELPSLAGGHSYLPALDGLRALAVAAVIAYHFDFHWANGGYLGVDFFFVLSGFLITSLLVGEWHDTRRIRLRSFWSRRARRLLPAVMVLLVVLTLYAWLGGPNIDLSTFRPDEVATLFYYANWHLIATNQSYFAQFQIPSPLKHTWSLAIEEQFYLVWPLLLGGVLWVVRRRSKGGAFPRRLLVVGVGLTALASAAWMADLYHRGVDPSRVYYGTDTRAFELLIGAVLAIVTTNRPAPSAAARRSLHLVGPVAAVVLAVFWVVAGDDQGNPSGFMYTGGLVVAGILAAAVIASVAQPDPGPLGAVLSIRPLRWVGMISYGLYLWHWPAYVLMTDLTTGLSGAWLLSARLAATLAAAVTSFYLVERPVRRFRWRGWPLTFATLGGLGVTTAIIIAGTAPVATAQVPPSRTGQVKVVAPTARPDPVPPRLVLPAGTIVSHTQPLRVMTIGDSVMFDAEVGITAALQATGEATVTTHGFPGWGLLNDPGFAHDLTQLIQQDHPQVIIGMWSWDNNDALAHPVQYRALINEAVRVMLAPQNGVDGIAFVQFPSVGPRGATIDPTLRREQENTQNAGTRAWNSIVSTLPAAYPGKVTFLRVASSLDVHGHYSTWLPTVNGGWVRARKTDNTHLCPAGAAVLGAAITDDLSPMFGLPPPAKGWIDGSWTHDVARFGVPVGGCPNDQP